MENAILLASGLGTRMRPLTEKKPKPLIEVAGIPMIETVISGLAERGVDRIYVVTGYLEGQFFYLKDRYKNIEFIHNSVYESVNNISSVYAARNILGRGDCFICEADLFVLDKKIFNADLKESCYFGCMVKGHSDDWVLEQDRDGTITRVGKRGDDCYNMAGIAYFREADARKLSACVAAEYGRPGYEELFWDDVVDRHIKEFKLKVHPVGREQIVEIDTVEELEHVNRSRRQRFEG